MPRSSTFYNDGYCDGLNNTEPSPPDHGVYGQEYLEGYKDGQNPSLQAEDDAPAL